MACLLGIVVFVVVCGNVDVVVEFCVAGVDSCGGGSGEGGGGGGAGIGVVVVVVVDCGDVDAVVVYTQYGPPFMPP